MKGIGYIYKITNLINGKFYIGKTKVSVNQRYNRHIKDSSKYNQQKRYISHLYRAMNEYGVANFSVETVEECAYDELSDRERFWIEFLDARNPLVGYNICKGGEGGPGGARFKGHKHTEITKQKMSEDRSGSGNANFGNRYKLSEEQLARHHRFGKAEDNPIFGTHRSEETKNKISEKKKGKIIINNGSVSIFISPTELQKYESEGWKRGRHQSDKNS